MVIITRNENNLNINDRYLIEARIGSGSFGVVYMGTDTKTGESVALKTDKNTSKNFQTSLEAATLNALRNSVGIPHLY